MSRRVVITGIGCITPLGHEPRSVWNALVSGQSGAGPITLFDASNFPVRIAAEVRDWDMSQVGEDPAHWQRHARQTQFAVAAAINAHRVAGLADYSIDPVRVGVSTGCGEIFPDFVRFAELMGGAIREHGLDNSAYIREAIQTTLPYEELNFDPGIAACHIAGILQAQGANVNFTTACVSSSVALGEAAEVIRRDQTDVMYAGGAHSMIHPFGVTGFHRLSTLSTQNDSPTTAARPFDRDRNGFVIGEGGIIFVLEELEHARRRGAEIWAELSGYGATDDAFRITDPSPGGKAASRCMSLAIHDARLNPEDIDYINAHGSGTLVNDEVETNAIKKTFGQLAYGIPVSSTKSMTGHLTTACGAIEFLACVMAVQNGVVPPTINYDTADPACDLDYVPNTARDVVCNHVLSNSLGFGGQNVSLVVSRFTG